MADWLVFVIVLTAFGSGMYLVGHARGRQAGWADARSYRSPGDEAGA